MGAKSHSEENLIMHAQSETEGRRIWLNYSDEFVIVENLQVKSEGKEKNLYEKYVSWWCNESTCCIIS